MESTSDGFCSNDGDLTDQTVQRNSWNLKYSWFFCGKYNLCYIPGVEQC